MAEISGRCFKEIAHGETPPLIQNGHLVLQAYHFGWIISGVFALVAIVVSIWLINNHLKWYTNKHEQRYIVRILFIPPLYALVSFASYLFWNHATPLILLRDAYEAIVLTAFFYLLLLYVHPEPDGQKEVFRKVGISREADAEAKKRGKKVRRWMWPLGSMRAMPKDGLYFLQIMKWAVLQYCVIRPMTTLAAVVLDYVGLYCEDSWSPGWGHVYIISLISLSVTIAMYCLLQLYVPVADRLKPHRPLLKLFAIKAVVFLTFWQATFLGVLSSLGVIKGTSYMTADDVNIGIGALLETFEMAVFAIMHINAFSYKPYCTTSTTRREAEDLLIAVYASFDIDSHSAPSASSGSRTRPVTKSNSRLSRFHASTPTNTIASADVGAKPKKMTRLRALAHAFDFRETLREVWEGCVYMVQRGRGEETDVTVRRARMRRDVFGRPAPVVVNVRREKTQRDAVSVQRKEKSDSSPMRVDVEGTKEVHFDCTREAVSGGTNERDHAYTFTLSHGRREPSAGLSEQIERELERRGVGSVSLTRPPPHDHVQDDEEAYDSGQTQPEEIEIKHKWWQGVYDRLSGSRGSASLEAEAEEARDVVTELPLSLSPRTRLRAIGMSPERGQAIPAHAQPTVLGRETTASESPTIFGISASPRAGRQRRRRSRRMSSGGLARARTAGHVREGGTAREFAAVRMDEGEVEALLDGTMEELTSRDSQPESRFGSWRDNTEQERTPFIERGTAHEDVKIAVKHESGPERVQAVEERTTDLPQGDPMEKSHGQAHHETQTRSAHFARSDSVLARIFPRLSRKPLSELDGQEIAHDHFISSPPLSPLILSSPLLKPPAPRSVAEITDTTSISHASAPSVHLAPAGAPRVVGREVGAERTPVRLQALDHEAHVAVAEDGQCAGACAPVSSLASLVRSASAIGTSLPMSAFVSQGTPPAPPPVRNGQLPELKKDERKENQRPQTRSSGPILGVNPAPWPPPPASMKQQASDSRVFESMGTAGIHRAHQLPQAASQPANPLTPHSSPLSQFPPTPPTPPASYPPDHGTASPPRRPKIVMPSPLARVEVPVSTPATPAPNPSPPTPGGRTGAKARKPYGGAASESTGIQAQVPDYTALLDAMSLSRYPSPRVLEPAAPASEGSWTRLGYFGAHKDAPASTTAVRAEKLHERWPSRTLARSRPPMGPRAPMSPRATSLGDVSPVQTIAHPSSVPSVGYAGVGAGRRDVRGAARMRDLGAAQLNPPYP